MDRRELARILEALSNGETDVEATIERLRNLPFEDLGFAKIDHLRPLRRGLDEVILAGPKQTAEVVAAAEALWREHGRVLATRVTAEQGQALAASIAQGRYDPVGRTFAARRSPPPSLPTIAVVTAGTADRAVAAEAEVTLEHDGHPVLRVADCGVAGLHRLAPFLDPIERAAAAVVIAGMEGALPSVVAGLVSTPVIAVPTSVGYGAALGGLTALLGMLTSCAPGVCVVNIDNGYGAACAASLIARRVAAAAGSAVDSRARRDNGQAL